MFLRALLGGQRAGDPGRRSSDCSCDTGYRSSPEEGKRRLLACGHAEREEQVSFPPKRWDPGRLLDACEEHNYPGRKEYFYSRVGDRVQARGVT